MQAALASAMACMTRACSAEMLAHDERHAAFGVVAAEVAADPGDDRLAALRHAGEDGAMGQGGAGAGVDGGGDPGLRPGEGRAVVALQRVAGVAGGVGHEVEFGRALRDHVAADGEEAREHHVGVARGLADQRQFLRVLHHPFGKAEVREVEPRDLVLHDAHEPRVEFVDRRAARRLPRAPSRGPAARGPDTPGRSRPSRPARLRRSRVPDAGP